MTALKRYLAVILIAVFSVAVTGAVAMAHCDHSASGHVTPGIEKKMDGCSHSHSTEDKEHHKHNNNNADDKAQDHTDSDKATDGNAGCIDCTSGLCKSQNVVQADITEGFSASPGNFHSEKDPSLKSIFLSITSEPPISIS